MGTDGQRAVFASNLRGPNAALKTVTVKLGPQESRGGCGQFRHHDAAVETRAWTGGFPHLPKRRREGLPEPWGAVVFSSRWVRAGRGMEALWDPRKNGFVDPGLPRDWAHWRGLYLHGDQVVLSYDVSGVGVVGSPRSPPLADRLTFRDSSV